MAEESANNSASGLPPKLDLRKTGVLKGDPGSVLAPAVDVTAAARETRRVDTPAPAPAAVPRPVVTTVPGMTDVKREIPRINLEAVRPAGVPTGAGQSVQPPPAPLRPKPIMAPPTAIRVTTPEPVPGAGAVGDKKRTSRISLDTAFIPDQKGGRPVQGAVPEMGHETTTVRISQRPKTKRAVLKDDEAPSEGEVTKTSRIEAVEADESSTPTRRKTIKVKRPTQRTGVGGVVSVARVAPGQQRLTVAQPAGDEPENIFFPIWASLAVVVTMVLIYMFGAQAFGPDGSLSPLSCWKEGPNMSWYAKVPPSLLAAQLTGIAVAVPEESVQVPAVEPAAPVEGDAPAAEAPAAEPAAE